MQSATRKAAMSSARTELRKHLLNFKEAPEGLVLVAAVSTVLSLGMYKLFVVDMANPDTHLSGNDPIRQDSERAEAWSKAAFHKGPLAFFGFNNREVLGIKPSDGKLKYPPKGEALPKKEE